MNTSTRERLIQASNRLFADNGYRGASVRDICNLAGANPGAVSYHFGGKRQLYRAVLRRAAESLADLGPDTSEENTDREPISVLDAPRRLLDRMQTDDAATRLLLRDLADGGIVFSATDAEGEEDSTFVEAAVVFDKPPEYVWKLLYRTEDQVNFLEEVEAIKILKKEELEDNLEFRLKILFMTFVYRVIHHFDKEDLHIHWGLDPSFDNDLSDLHGFWKLHPYGEGKTLARYGSRVSVKNVPQWLESLFKRRGVEKSLVAVRKYVNSGGVYRK